MPESGPNQPSQPHRIEQSLRSDSPSQLLSDIIGDIRRKRDTLPDIRSAFLPHKDKDVVLNFLEIKTNGKHTQVGFHWKDGDEGNLSLSKPASKIERVLFGATVNRQGLPEDAIGIEKEFRRAKIDSGIVVVPLLYSLGLRNPTLAKQYVDRAEALESTTIGSWDDGDGLYCTHKTVHRC